jgi:DNA-binding NarL/FixJ family response regulator
MPAQSILIVSPDPTLATRLTGWLETQHDISLIGVVGTLAEACVHVTANVIVVDLACPDAADEEMWAEFRFCNATAQLICLFADEDTALLRRAMICLFADEDTALLRRAMISGAQSFIPKTLDYADLLSQLSYALDGKPTLPNEHFLERILSATTNAPAQTKEALSIGTQAEALTEREASILRLLADGLSNKEIADRLNLSAKTVRNNLNVIYGKLQVNNRTQAAVWAREHGLKG